MGKVLKKKYDRYTLAYKLQAVKLANHPGIMSKRVAEVLGIHPVMLYRWQMEHRNGDLSESRHLKAATASPQRRLRRAGSEVARETELVKARKRIKALEAALASRDEELDLLKKAQRFFAERKARSTSSSRRTGKRTR